MLDAKGVGPALALGLLSTLTAERLVRAIREKDIATLQSVPRVGRKKAEQLILDLADKLDDLQVSGAGRASVAARGAGAEDAIRALVSLGYSTADAERPCARAGPGGRATGGHGADRARCANSIRRRAAGQAIAPGITPMPNVQRRMLAARAPRRSPNPSSAR